VLVRDDNYSWEGHFVKKITSITCIESWGSKFFGENNILSRSEITSIEFVEGRERKMCVNLSRNK